MPTSHAIVPKPPCESSFIANLRHWSGKLPLWTLALMLMLPVIVLISIPMGHPWFPGWLSDFRYFLLTDVAVFLPGALKRWSWRQALIMLAIAALAYTFTFIPWQKHVPYPYNSVPIIPLLIGFGEWWVHPFRRIKSLVQILLLTGSAAVFVSTLMPFTERYFYYHRHTVDVAYCAFWLLLALLSWLAISFSSEQRNFLPASLFLTASVGWFLLFFIFIFHPLVRRSLLHGQPFSRTYSLRIMGKSPQAADDQILWDAITSADWSIPDQNEPFDNDYRKGCIDLLSQHNRPAAAALLSELLRRQPSLTLADFSASILAQEHRYETAPELMRYSLPLSKSNHTRDALISMRIPQAALATLLDDAVAHKMIEYESETDNSSLEFDSSRAQLAQLLGKDVGNRWKAWAEVYDSTIATRPTPLTPAQADEVNRVIAATEKYWKAKSALQHQHRLSEINQCNLDIPGTAAYEQAIAQLSAAAKPSPPTTINTENQR